MTAWLAVPLNPVHLPTKLLVFDLSAEFLWKKIVPVLNYGIYLSLIVSEILSSRGSSACLDDQIATD